MDPTTALQSLHSACDLLLPRAAPAARLPGLATPDEAAALGRAVAEAGADRLGARALGLRTLDALDGRLRALLAHVDAVRRALLMATEAPAVTNGPGGTDPDAGAAWLQRTRDTWSDSFADDDDDGSLPLFPASDDDGRPRSPSPALPFGHVGHFFAR